MTKFECLEEEAYEDGINIIQRNFRSDRIRGLYCDGTVALNHNIATSKEKSCILAEELGHHYTTVGDILDQNQSANRKQEQQARTWAYNKLIGLMGIVDSYKAGCRSTHDMAEYLNVTEEFLMEALERYKQKYGSCVTVDNYIIYFEPYLGILEVRK